MSAERMPQGDTPLLARPLAWITRLVVRFPVPVVAMGVMAAVFALVMTASHLGFRTSRLDLLNPDSGFNRLWTDYINEFGDQDDAVVVVQGGGQSALPPGPQAGYWPMSTPAPAASRQFQVLVGDDLLLDH